jgi:uncharacterized membrane protein
MPPARVVRMHPASKGGRCDQSERMQIGIFAGTSRMALATIFVVAGVLHFTITETYVGVMPPYLPWPRELVRVSGVCQVAGGVGLCVPRLRRVAGWGLVLLLVAVWPANLHMYTEARSSGAPAWRETLLLLRLPLQLVLIWWVWKAAELPAPGRRAPRPSAET